MSGGAGDPIIVASAVDLAYLPLAEVVATSIAASASSGRPVHYHVLYDGPDSAATRRLDGWHSGAVTVTLHRLTNPYARFGTVSGFPAATFFRLALEQVLPDCPRLIYLDTDLVVETDLAPLFDAPLNDHAVGATINCPLINLVLGDPPSDPARAARAIEMRAYLSGTLGLDTDEKIAGYMQAGVLLLDLDALRAMRYADAVTAVVDQHRNALLYADQCAMNLVLSGRMTPIDPRWNTLPEALLPGALEATSPRFRPHIALQRQEPWIRHFAYRKPWHVLGLPGSDRWWHHARRSGLGWHFVGAFVARRGIRGLRAAGKSLRQLLPRPAAQKN